MYVRRYVLTYVHTYHAYTHIHACMNTYIFFVVVVIANDDDDVVL